MYKHVQLCSAPHFNGNRPTLPSIVSLSLVAYDVTTHDIVIYTFNFRQRTKQVGLLFKTLQVTVHGQLISSEQHSAVSELTKLYKVCTRTTENSKIPVTKTIIDSLYARQVYT